MKTIFCLHRKSAFLAGLALGFIATLARADLPVIESIRVENTNLVVTTRVPPAHARVTLEARSNFGRGAWTPVAVQHLAAPSLATTLTFRLPRSGECAMLRVRADACDPLPTEFYSGTAVFGSGAAS